MEMEKEAPRAVLLPGKKKILVNKLLDAAIRIENDIATRILNGYQHDEIAKQLLGAPEELPPFFEIDEKGLILFKDVIYLPNHENL